MIAIELFGPASFSFAIAERSNRVPRARGVAGATLVNEHQHVCLYGGACAPPCLCLLL